MWTLAACVIPHQSFAPGPADDTDTVLSTASTGATGDTGPASTAETGGPTIDCTIRPEATLVRYHDYIDSSEDFTFDDEGYLWGVSVTTSALIRTPLDGDREPMLPDVSSWGRGVRFLPDGDIVIAEPDRGALLRIDRVTMGSTLITGGYNQPNGLAIDDAGFVHLTQAAGGVWRIDPVSGEQTELHDSPVSTDGITFSPDYRRLNWDSESGEIITMLFDDDGVIVEEPHVLTTLPVSGGQGLSILDGMAADACGNLYVIVMSGRVIRILPDGTDELVFDVSSHEAGTFISAVNFGSGIGGWERDHIYVMSLSAGLFEIDVGIVGRPEVHLPR